MIYYQFLNIFFFVFHTILVFFNLFGWIHPKTRKWNAFTLILTTLSWFALGYFYGFGYCVCTDWHFQVMEKLGYKNLPYSYIKLVLDFLFQANFDPFWVDVGTASGYIFAVASSLIANFPRRNR